MHKKSAIISSNTPIRKDRVTHQGYLCQDHVNGSRLTPEPQLGETIGIEGIYI